MIVLYCFYVVINVFLYCPALVAYSINKYIIFGGIILFVTLCVFVSKIIEKLSS